MKEHLKLVRELATAAETKDRSRAKGVMRRAQQLIRDKCSTAEATCGSEELRAGSGQGRRCGRSRKMWRRGWEMGT